jgi:hypothetical protein
MKKSSCGAQAILAFGTFCRQYVSKDSASAGLARDYLALLKHEKPTIRRGSAAALGALPPWLLRPFAEEVLLALARATEVGHGDQQRSAIDTRSEKWLR